MEALILAGAFEQQILYTNHITVDKKKDNKRVVLLVFHKAEFHTDFLFVLGEVGQSLLWLVSQPVLGFQ